VAGVPNQTELLGSIFYTLATVYSSRPKRVLLLRVIILRVLVGPLGMLKIWMTTACLHMTVQAYGTSKTTSFVSCKVAKP